MLGYSMSGMPRYEHEGFCDDQENEAGKLLLSLLKKNNLQNVAIFVVRIHNGPKLGQSRFNLIAKAVQNAVRKNPKNEFMQTDMEINLVKPDATLKKGIGTKYERTQKEKGRNPIRGSYRGRGASMSGEYHAKRRREESPPFNMNSGAWGADLGYNFSEPMAVGFEQPIFDDGSLGGSWPSLAHSQRRK